MTKENVMIDVVKMTDQELIKKLNNLLKDKFNLNMKKAVGSLSNTSEVKLVRKTIARIKTEINSRRQAGGSK